MIVKNAQLTYERANDISNKMIETFGKESSTFDDEGDPAEQIYLTLHTLSSLTYKLMAAMDGYAKVYNIEKFNGKVFREWVNKTVIELVKNNRNAGEDVYKQFKEEVTQ